MSERVDRLSALPDEILRHILSFLDTKYMVRTSLLSKAWKDLWTTVPVLNFDSSRFKKFRSFKKFVSSVLCRRDSDTTVSAFGFRCTEDDERFLERIIVNYVISHNVSRHLILQVSWHGGESFPRKLLDYQTLETLQLKGFRFQKSFSFTALISLPLEHCLFSSRGESDNYDMFSGCPNLNNLYIRSCYGWRVLKILGPQLLSLTIKTLDYYPEKVEISAPKLTFFSWENTRRVECSIINLPSLQSAHINLLPAQRWENTDVEQQKYVVKLFEGISNAEFLTVSQHSIKALAEVSGLEHIPCPFSRLKRLDVKHSPKDGSFTIPAKVSNYLRCRP